MKPLTLEILMEQGWLGRALMGAGSLANRIGSARKGLATRIGNARKSFSDKRDSFNQNRSTTVGGIEGEPRLQSSSYRDNSKDLLGRTGVRKVGSAIASVGRAAAKKAGEIKTRIGNSAIGSAGKFLTDPTSPGRKSSLSFPSRPRQLEFDFNGAAKPTNSNQAAARPRQLEFDFNRAAARPGSQDPRAKTAARVPSAASTGSQDPRAKTAARLPSNVKSSPVVSSPTKTTEEPLRRNSSSPAIGATPTSSAKRLPQGEIARRYESSRNRARLPLYRKPERESGFGDDVAGKNDVNLR